MHMHAFVVLYLCLLGHLAVAFPAPAIANSALRARGHRQLVGRNSVVEARDGDARFTFYDPGL
jgi:hypothetical protein